MTTQEEIRKNLKDIRDKKEESLSQEKLELELGEGVEKDPEDPGQAKEFPGLDLTNAFSVRNIIDELKQLPTSEDLAKQMEKVDAYENYARKIWKLKKADLEYFDIPLRTVVKVDKIKIGENILEKTIWKSDDKGRYVTESKRFYYHGATIQDNDILQLFQNERDDKHFSCVEEAAKIQKMIKDPSLKDKEGYDEYAGEKIWQTKIMAWHKSQQDYWITVFKLYYNATDDDISRMVYDDIVLYADVALYKAGVKSPKSEGS